MGVTRYDPRRVAPFGYPRIKAWLAAPRGFSQLPHVLLRLLKPRHPPDTLSSLGNIFLHIAAALPRILGQLSTRSLSGTRQYNTRTGGYSCGSWTKLIVKDQALPLARAQPHEMSLRGAASLE